MLYYYYYELSYFYGMYHLYNLSGENFPVQIMLYYHGNEIMLTMSTCNHSILKFPWLERYFLELRLLITIL